MAYDPWGRKQSEFDLAVESCVDRCGRVGVFGVFIGIIAVLFFGAAMDVFFRIDISKHISGNFLGGAVIGWLICCIVILFGVGTTKNPLA